MAFVSLRVIIGYFHVVGVTVAPFKTDSPLVIDRDTKLTYPVTGKSMQPIP
jgi:hypothetical protein